MKNTLHIIIVSILVIYITPAYASLSDSSAFRGAWVATVAHIDWPSPTAVDQPEQQQKEMLFILDSLHQLGMNAIVFQVRPTADALYDSPLEPWSHWLTGKQGKKCPYDPLQFTIEEAKKRGIEVHAWINPYRINIASMKTSILAPNHLFFRMPQWFWKYGEQWYFNPAMPETREWICAVVEDIVCRYDIAAIHMDDYFYPYPIGGTELPDKDDFNRSPRGFTDIRDWRRDNVNQTIEALSKTIHSTNKKVAFGISPFGVYKEGKGLTNYYDLYADILYWIEQGWIDYVTPQLYWNIGYEKADYAQLAQWWATAVAEANQQYDTRYGQDNPNHHRCKLYIGMAPYRLGSDKEGAAWRNGNEIARQMRLNRSINGIDGECFYSTQPLLKNPRHVCDSIRSFYQIDLTK